MNEMEKVIALGRILELGSVVKGAKKTKQQQRIQKTTNGCPVAFVVF